MLISLLVLCPLWAQDTGLTLDSCLCLARQNNTAVRRADLQVEKARQVRQQALTKYFPQISASALGYHSLHPLVEIGAEDIRYASVRDLLVTLYGNYGAALGLDPTLSLFQYGYNVGVTAIQPVFVGGKIVAGNRLAELGIEAAELQRDIASRDALEQVEECYWLVVGLTEKQATLASMSSLLDTLQHTVDAAVHAGLALSSDIMQVSLRIDETRRLEVQLNNGLRLARRALAQSIGLDSVGTLLPPAFVDPSDSLLTLPSLNQQSTPESRLLALQVRAAELERQMALADALPQIAVGANYGYGKLQMNILNDNLGSSTGNGAVFMTVSVPLTQWWETGHKLREHDLRIEDARLEQRDLDEKLLLRQQQTFDQMTEAAWLVRECRNAVTKSEENYRLTGVNYRAGMATITDLLTAQSMLLKAQNDLTDAHIAYVVSSRRFFDLQ